MIKSIYFPISEHSYNSECHLVLFQTGNEDTLITYGFDYFYYVWFKMRGQYYPIDKISEPKNNIDILQYLRHHINGYRKYRSKYWEFIQDKKANCKDWIAEQLAFKTWEFPDLETENVEARLPRDYEEPRNLIYATFEEPHVFYIFNPPQRRNK